MFIEPNFLIERRGWIEVICGSMFSGKTEELIRRLKRAKIANFKVKIFKPSIDLRFDENAVVSHDSNFIHSTTIAKSEELLQLAGDVNIIGIDEAQFFDEGIITVCQTLSLQGIRVIVAGLDMDYKANPFGPMPQLLAIADFITKLHAICVRCGSLANMSYRKTANQDQILIGEQDVYEPRCRKCYYEGS